MDQVERRCFGLVCEVKKNGSRRRRVTASISGPAGMLEPPGWRSALIEIRVTDAAESDIFHARFLSLLPFLLPVCVMCCRDWAWGENHLQKRL